MGISKSRVFQRGFFSLLVIAGFATLGGISSAHAAPTYVGPEKCQECHKAEHGVWEGTQHFTSFREVHRNENAKAILEAAGGKGNMRRSDVCATCHYTVIDNRAVSGPSCESCHGPASEYINIHNDYGGPAVKREDETAAHKAERMKNAAAAGMLWPSNLYGVASNCLSCHGMTNDDLDGATLAAMIDAGHPIHSNFELVKYSQGQVRHRFYPPDVTVNKEPSKAELARLYAVGQAAALVSSVQAQGKTDNAKYLAVQKEREAAAREALGAISDAKTLLASPTAANAKAFADAIAGKDLTGAVGGMLPAPSSYK